MPSPINRKTLKYLAELARLDLLKKEEDRLVKDLQKVLEHFEELAEVTDAEVTPMTGGTNLKNVFREDEKSSETNTGAGVQSFPEEADGFLKIPPVFEKE